MTDPPNHPPRMSLVPQRSPRGPCVSCGKKRVPKHERPVEEPMLCGDCQRRFSLGKTWQ